MSGSIHFIHSLSSAQIPTVSSSSSNNANCCSKPVLSALQLRRYSERLENPWFSAILTARPPAPVLAARRLSRIGFGLLEGRRKRAAPKGKEELEQYLNNGGEMRNGRTPTTEAEEGTAAEVMDGLLPAAGYCAVCHGQLAEGECFLIRTYTKLYIFHRRWLLQRWRNWH
jgi:hypothetical protein